MCGNALVATLGNPGFGSSALLKYVLDLERHGLHLQYKCNATLAQLRAVKKVGMAPVSTASLHPTIEGVKTCN